MSLIEFAQVGMAPAWHAQQFPHQPALITNYGDRTWAQLNANANRLVRVFRSAGINAGDAVAIVLKNRPEFIETLLAAMRSGLRLTPINFHLRADEIGYIVDNCEAKAFIADASIGAAAIDGYFAAPTELAAQS